VLEQIAPDGAAAQREQRVVDRHAGLLRDRLDAIQVEDLRAERRCCETGMLNSERGVDSAMRVELSAPLLIFTSVLTVLSRRAPAPPPPCRLLQAIEQ